MVPCRTEVLRPSPEAALTLQDLLLQRLFMLQHMRTGLMFPVFLIADPRIIDNPEPIKVITYRELRELSLHGSKRIT